MDQLPLLGGLSGLAVFAAVIFYLLRANAVYRTDYRTGNEAWQMRLAAEVKAGDARLAAEVKAHARTQEMLDAERERRRVAEDTAWQAMRETAPELAKLSAEVTRLRTTVTGSIDDDPR